MENNSRFPSYQRRRSEVSDKDSPVFRRLRGYAFDPSLSISMETAFINTITLKIPWEENLQPGPIGEYVEVIDHDPASGCFYDPVDLNERKLLAQDGLPPSETNPKFHQQMVYAVAMYTIANFEKAMGRRVLWATKKTLVGDSFQDDSFHPYVSRLRIYPHALRQANAYYSPQKVSLLFGYFPADPNDVTAHLPGGTVFTCLAHDIIAHEVTHAILDGMYKRLVEPTHPDNLAFHEAFADIIALFQRFTFPEVLRNQIVKTRGDLQQESLLGQLAQEFGVATGNYGALRSAIGKYGADGKWAVNQVDASDYLTIMEPHYRGAILVAAVFDAFISIYKMRVGDLFRIATNGSGVHPAGELNTDLVNRLAYEANRTAQHVLTMCIRALDYCPPNEITFGDFLRALVTSDLALVPEDDLQYRLAFVEAFKRRGIYPEGLTNMSVESLKWERRDMRESDQFNDNNQSILGFLMSYFRGELKPKNPQVYNSGQLGFYFYQDYYKDNREETFKLIKSIKYDIHQLIEEQIKLDANFKTEFEKLTELCLSAQQAEILESKLKKAIADGKLRGVPSIKINKEQWDADGHPKFEIHSVSRAKRVGPGDKIMDEVVMMITQRIRIKVKGRAEEIKFRGGVTIIMDLSNLTIKYAIIKSMRNVDRLVRQIKYMTGVTDAAPKSVKEIYIKSSKSKLEPFAILHKSDNDKYFE